MYWLGSFLEYYIISKDEHIYLADVCIVYDNNHINEWHDHAKTILFKNGKWYSFTWVLPSGDKKQIHKTTSGVPYYTILSNCDEYYNPVGLFMLWNKTHLKQISICDFECNSHGLEWVYIDSIITAAIYNSGKITHGPFKIYPIGKFHPKNNKLFPNKYTFKKTKGQIINLLSDQYSR